MAVEHPDGVLDPVDARTLIRAFRQVLGADRVKVLPDGILIETVTSGGVDQPLTTQQAADLVGVSRPFLAKQIDQGTIPLFNLVANQRRVLRKDVMAWHARMQAGRTTALTDLDALLDDEMFG